MSRRQNNCVLKSKTFLPTSTQGQINNMTNPSGTMALKLRHSCDACALSKVKCHKQKPTCSRCQRRGVDCHYLAIKRASRRYSIPRVDSTQVSPTSGSGPNLELSDLSAWLSTSTTTSLTDSSNDDMFLRQLLSTDTSSVGTPFVQSSTVNSASALANGDLFVDHSLSTVSTPCTASNSLDLGSGVLSPVNLSMDLDDYLPSPMNFWTPRMPEMSTMDSGIEPQPWIADATTAPTTGYNTCIARVTHIMQQQFHPKISPKSSNISGAPREQDSRTDTPSLILDAVIDANKQVIDSVSTMLHCQCLYDGYLLTIVSLIVFKVLDSYGTAASAPEAQEPDIDMMEDDELFLAAQRVLGELHRVQRLVNQLSINIKRHTATKPEEKKLETLTSCGQERESEVALPFSPVMLSQLETEMRQRLKCLSLGMAAHLRRD